MRESKVYLEDILEAIDKIERYTKKVKTYEKFSENELVIDAVTRNLEIIGEATKHIPLNLRKKYPKTDWKKISGLRDILIHAYFGINLNIIWDVVKNKLPELKTIIKEISEKESS